eukprot:CAMPEP_0118971398 /NCGR_PEP_ID=MMETSP1173-20130426/8032_1 /TAXON_ID=1034831 /ORGANISM="Rhizochromulina marina cf, Strain CCMP1243" /LENGTH=231 /DNA_ID=CAMNT_0006920843 /DNA_START=95 /DNA_END=787 /DNA_ORIENTATION=+
MRAAESLALPAEFVAEKVRTRHEAAVLLGIGRVARRLDAAVGELAALAPRAWDLATLVSGVRHGSSAPVYSLLPHVNQAKQAECLGSDALRQQHIAECRDSLRGLAQQLEPFAEQNESMAHEFFQAGCTEKGVSKNALALVERTLLCRLRWLVDGPDAAAFPADSNTPSQSSPSPRASQDSCFWHLPLDGLYDGECAQDHTPEGVGVLEKNGKEEALLSSAEAEAGGGGEG